MTRRAHDFYETPDWCVRLAMEHIPLPPGRWLEPAAGHGALIRASGHAYWSAIEVRPEAADHLDVPTTIGDFLAMEPRDGEFDAVVTNPPYSQAEAFARHALGWAPHVVMLLRLAFLSSQRRAGFIRETKPDVYVLPKRPSFTGKGTDSYDYAWFHWWPHRRPGGLVQVLPVAAP